MDYEIFYPDVKNVTESNFFLQKFCINFRDYKRIKTQIYLKKDMRNACPKAEKYVWDILQTQSTNKS